MGARRLAADCLRLLATPPADVAVTAPHDRALAAALQASGAAASLDVARAAVVSFRGAAGDPAARGTCLDVVRSQLPPGAPLVVVDHNQPRTWPLRLVAVAALALRGQGPARARHPTARELAATGWTVVSLRLACGERAQLVLVRTRDGDA